MRGRLVAKEDTLFRAVTCIYTQEVGEFVVLVAETSITETGCAVGLLGNRAINKVPKANSPSNEALVFCEQFGIF